MFTPWQDRSPTGETTPTQQNLGKKGKRKDNGTDYTPYSNCKGTTWT